MSNRNLIFATAGQAGEESDPDFANTVLLLHGDGTNGAQNNTFLDSSTNNFTITRNGNTTQGSFSPFSKPDGRWGNYFDGSGDYLSIADNAAFDFGTGDFTIEFWMRFAVLPSSTAVAMISTYSGGSDGYYIQYRTDLGGRNLRFGDSANVFIDDTAFNPNVNQWYHIAVARSGTALRMYIDGVVSSSTATNSTNFVSSVPFLIGHLAAGTQQFNGYISNVRVVKGTAVYTSNFTPSTTPLTAIANTSLLTCQSNRFVDNSTNNFAITRNGDVKVTPFSPFPITTEYSPSVNGGSGYFDGSDYLSVPDNAAWDYPGDFAIECWIYLNGTGQQHIYEGRVGSTSNALLFYLNSSTQPTIYINGSVVLGSSTVLTTGQWYYLVASRVSGTLYLFINGVSAATPVANSVSITSPGVIRVGTNDAANGSFLNGYLSGLKVLKGSGYSSVTVPTSPPSSDANTSLLCNFTNAGIFDNTGFNNLETIADCAINTTTKKYGTGSLEFDGTGDYLKVQNPIPPTTFGSGDFTIEFWFNASATSTTMWLFDGRIATPADGSYPAIYINSSNNLIYYVNAAARITGSTALSTGTWYHIAVVRSSGTTKMYLDGVQEGSNYTDTTVYADCGAGRPAIGIATNIVQGFNGYIDDLRITKGVARYLTTFTPPDKAFPNIGA